MTRKASVAGRRSTDSVGQGSAQSTREQLLDAAEQLFAAKGYASVSVRTVTEAAKQNLALVSYHFGSKEGLLRAVYMRRAAELNEERRRLIDDAVSRYGNRPLPLEEVLRAMLTPPIAWARERASGRAQFILFLLRCYHDTTPSLKRLRLRKAENLRDIVLPYLRRALPSATDDDLYWGIQFSLGSMHYAIADRGSVNLVSHGAADATAVDETIDRLVAFVAGGFVAGLTDKTGLQKRASTDRPRVQPVPAGF